MAFSSVYKLAPSALRNCLGFQKSLATALHLVYFEELTFSFVCLDRFFLPWTVC